MPHGKHGAATSSLMIIICLVWGFTFVAGKAGVSEIPPMLFTALRYILLSAILLPFLRIVEGHMTEVIFSLAMGSAFCDVYGGMSLADNVSAVAVATQLGVPFATIMSIVFGRACRLAALDRHCPGFWRHYDYQL